MNKKRNVFGFVLALLIIVSTFCVSVSADTNEWDMSVNSDGSVMASFDSETKTLTVSGTGAIKDFTTYGQSQLSSIRSNVEHLIIEEGITTIGKYAFSSYYSSWGLSNLQTIELPSTLTNINDYAFYNMGNVSVTIPSGVTSIGANAFKSSKISSVSFELGSSLTTIGESAFIYCSNLTEIHIPNGVTTINSETFRNCSSLETLELPSTITSIKSNAFESCPKVKNLIWTTESTPTLGGNALGYVSGSTNKIMGYNAVGKVATLDADNRYLIDLFEANGFTVTKVDNDGLDPYLSYPSSSIYSLGENIKAYYNVGTKTLDVVGSGVMTNYNSRSTPLIDILNDVQILNIDEGITSIGDYAFLYSYSSTSSLKNVTSITFPSTLTSIGKSSFKYAGFTSVTIPSGVTSIGESAFASSKISSISFELGSSLTTIGESAFSNCSNLENVTLPTTITSLGKNAFYQDAKVKTFTWPIESTPTLGTDVFGSYSNVIGVNATNKTATLDADNAYLIDAFESLGYVITKVDNDGLDPLDSYPSSAIKDLGEHVKGYYNGYKKTLLVKGYGPMTDYSSSPLDYLSSIQNLIIDEGITTIGNNVFYIPAISSRYDPTVLSSLTSIELPSTLTKIGDRAFVGTQLTNITIPSSVTTIGNSAISSNKSLLTCEIEEGSSLTTIGNNAFSSNTSITSIDIPEGVESIGDYAFAYCTNLESITLPTTITSLGKYAFDNDKKVKTFIWPIESTPTLGSEIFGNSSMRMGSSATNKTATLDADNAYLIDAFESVGYVVTTVDNDGLSPYASYPSNEIYDYGENINGYYNSYSGELVVVGTGAMNDYHSGYIGSGYSGPSYPYQVPTKAKKIIISEGITHIGDNAFSYLTANSQGFSYTYRPTNLTELVLPSTLESIGDGAFYGASSLETVNLPNGLESIGYNAFYNASSLELLSIPSTVETIGENAFGGTHNNLTTVYNYAEDSQTLGDTVMGSKTGIDYVLYSTNTNFDTQIKAISPNTITYLDSSYPTSGTLENGVKWIYNSETHTLTFSGDGEITNQTSGSQPWYGAATAGGGISNYTFGTGITGIGSGIFGYYGGNTSWGYGGDYSGVSTYSPEGLASSIASYAPQASNAERQPQFGDADNEVGNAGDNGSTYIIVDGTATIFKAAVPIKINVNQSADGSVSVLGEYTIDNLSPAGPILITDARLQMKTNWSIANYTDDYTNKPADSQVLGLQMNGANFNTDGTIILNSELSSSILHNEKKTLTFDAKLSAHKTSIENENIAAIIFTLDFDKVTEW